MNKKETKSKLNSTLNKLDVPESKYTIKEVRGSTDNYGFLLVTYKNMNNREQQQLSTKVAGSFQGISSPAAGGNSFTIYERGLEVLYWEPGYYNNLRVFDDIKRY